jgi:hypothetical protein
MTPVEQSFSDRKALYKMALRWAEQGRGAKAWHSHLVRNCQSILDRVPRKEVDAIISVVWSNWR